MSCNSVDAFPCEWSMPPMSANVESSRKPLSETDTSHVGSALYAELLAQGLSYFFPSASLESGGRADSTRAALVCDCEPDREEGDRVTFEWLGHRYVLQQRTNLFTKSERALIHSVGQVLSARYEALLNPDLAAKNLHLFRGLPEDRHVSAFLDPGPYANLDTLTAKRDRVTDSIEVLRAISLMTYENRRVSTGVLLLGPNSAGASCLPPTPEPLRYSSALTSIHAFGRLCDGVHTAALVDAAGWWRDIVDVGRWAESIDPSTLPLPSSSVYRNHCLSTYRTENLCLVLTPNGEIKAFAKGVQVFSFLNGRWRLTDMELKHRRWLDAVPDEGLANRILQVVLDLAESRRGALFVILDDARALTELVSSGDVLGPSESRSSSAPGTDSKRSVYYLLRGKRPEDIAPSLLRTLAAIDGGIVLDREGNLLAFGAILRHHDEPHVLGGHVPAGGRSTAALAASHLGKSLKVSEDGIVSFFDKGHLVWEM
ncbi:MAG: hypothetical protein KIT09_16310 [Bryobacteraceae bacterium]|nr:hypothetical protein [Bryobacteraceae bacterium]